MNCSPLRFKVNKMPQIVIENLDRKVITFNLEQRLLSILHDNHIDWMHSCGGKGRCTTCKMIVLYGMESLTPHSPFEKQCLEKQLLEKNQRLACQCVAKGDLRIRVPDENKLPHMDYSD